MRQRIRANRLLLAPFIALYLAALPLSAVPLRQPSSVGSGAKSGVLYHVTDLGALSTWDSWAYAISNYGQIVGWSQASDGNPHAFVWSPRKLNDFGTDMRDEGISGESSTALGINDFGRVVGYCQDETSPIGDWLAYLWNPDLTVRCLGTPGHHSLAMGINYGSYVVGEAVRGGKRHAFQCWYKDTSLGDLGTLPGGDTSSAHDINDRGWVVGSSNYTTEAPQDLIQHACIWSGGSAGDLGTLGGETSSANAINSKGSVVGAAQDAGGTTHAVLWGSAGGHTDLGKWCEAYDINDAGQVVGVSEAWGGHAFLWTAAAGTRDLNGLLDASSTGWELKEARSINSSGQIVGYGYNSWNQRHAFRAAPVPRPDMMIRTASETSYTGFQIYNATGSKQQKASTVARGHKVVYYLRARNNGSTSETITIHGTGGAAGKWRVAYYDAQGNIITGAVTGGGWPLVLLKATGSKDFRVEITPLTGAASGTTRSVRVTAQSENDPAVTDVVKSVTAVAAGAASSAQVTTLTALPTRTGGAQVAFRLAAAGDVVVSISNLAGREVALLRPGALEPGMHSVLWSGKSQTATQCPAGVYLVRVTANSSEGTVSSALASLRR